MEWGAEGTLSGPLVKFLGARPREGERFTIRGLRVPGAGEVDVCLEKCMLSEPLNGLASRLMDDSKMGFPRYV